MSAARHAKVMPLVIYLFIVISSWQSQNSSPFSANNAALGAALLTCQTSYVKSDRRPMDPCRRESKLDMSKVTNPFVIADRYAVTGKSANANVRVPLQVDAVYWSK